MDQPPMRVSLAGREKYERKLDEEQDDFVEGAVQEVALALPAPCLRRLSMPTDPGCQPDCVGRQRDGGCCADLVRGRASWTFTVDRDGFWVLDG